MNTFEKKNPCTSPVFHAANRLHLIIELAARNDFTTKMMYIHHTFSLLKSITRSGLTDDIHTTAGLRQSSALLSHSLTNIEITRIPIRLSDCVLSSIMRIFSMNSVLLPVSLFGTAYVRCFCTPDGFSLSNRFFCLFAYFIPFCAFFIPCNEQIKYTVFN